MRKYKKMLFRIILTLVLLIVFSLLPVKGPFETVIFIAIYAIIGWDIIRDAFKSLIHGQVFDENMLMAIATIGAFFIKEYSEAVAVMLFYQVGELFQSYAVRRSRNSIADLMDIRPDVAYVRRPKQVQINTVEEADASNGTLKTSFENEAANSTGNQDLYEIIELSPEEVHVGDIIVVKPGERVPLDGSIIEGFSTLDTSALTGESIPREAAAGDEIISGCINISGVLTIKVMKEYGESTVAKILDLVENASNRKATTEQFITKFARFYTPAVVGAAVLLAVIPPLFVQGEVFSDWLYRALSFLVVSCPCALVISIPLGFFGGIGGASRNGILVKGSNYLEALAATEIVVFDKTGTLTKGNFEVTKICPVDRTENELLYLAAQAEKGSNHPIAVSILNAFSKVEADSNLTELITNQEEVAGQGIKILLSGVPLFVGNARLMQAEQIEYQMAEQVGTIVYIAYAGKFVGSITIADTLKEDAVEAISLLKQAGIRKTVMLTGDVDTVGKNVAAQLKLDEVYTELLPLDKVNQLEELLAAVTKKRKLVYVGDGINDAPVLARADIGIAMGGFGSDAAIEAADIVIMTDEPSKIAQAIRISKKTIRIVNQNILFALGIKFGVLILVSLGLSNMWQAVFADVGVAVIAIINSMRALRIK